MDSQMKLQLKEMLIMIGRTSPRLGTEALQVIRAIDNRSKTLEKKLSNLITKFVQLGEYNKIEYDFALLTYKNYIVSNAQGPDIVPIKKMEE